MENIDLLGISSSLRDLIEDDDKDTPQSDPVTKFITTEDIFKAYRDDTDEAYKKLEGNVCVTGRIDNFNSRHFVSMMEVYIRNGRFRKNISCFESPRDTIQFKSSYDDFISLTVKLPKGNIIKDESRTKQYEVCENETDKVIYLEHSCYTELSRWFLEQEKLGNLYKGSMVKVYGRGQLLSNEHAPFATTKYNYDLVNTTKLELLNDNGDVVATWEPK